MTGVLDGKKILIVDDEPDVLETLEELLDKCLIDKAPDFKSAKKFLDKYPYDAAILDIMGVRGYDLLEVTEKKGIPAIMLTAHALSPDNLVKSIQKGAHSYVPKDKMSDIPLFLEEVILAREQGKGKQGNWFSRLKPFFDRKFGTGWREEHKEFWEAFDESYRVSKEEAGDVI